jgi:hypothetical protein
MKNDNYSVVTCRVLCRKGQEKSFINDMSDVAQKGITCLALMDMPATKSDWELASKIDPDNPVFQE